MHIVDQCQKDILTGKPKLKAILADFQMLLSFSFLKKLLSKKETKKKKKPLQ